MDVDASANWATNEPVLLQVTAALGMIGSDGGRAPLATLLRHLHELTPGPHPGPTLRFGGNSADDSAYLNNSDPLPAGIGYRINETDLAAYTTFVTRTAAKANLSLIIDTNFGTSPDPRMYALKHVEAVVRFPGLLPHVSGIEVGNEMDLYIGSQRPGRPPHRNASYTESEYSRVW